MAKPTRRATAKAAVGVLLEWIKMFGPPEEIFSDQGTHFIAELVTQYRAVCKSNAKFSPTYTAHPNMVERVNQTLVHSLRNYVDESHTNWDLYVEPCTAGYNKRYHKSLEMSPHEAVFGYKPRIPQLSEIQPTQYKFAKQHFKDLETIRETARLNLEKATKASTDQANKKRKTPHNFYKGELILIRKPRMVKPKSKKTTKFLPHYTTPYEVVKKLSDLSYVVIPYGQSDPKHREIAHISKIKRYYPRFVNNVTVTVPARNEIATIEFEPKTVARFPVDIILKTIDTFVDMLSNKGYNMYKQTYKLPYEFVQTAAKVLSR